MTSRDPLATIAAHAPDADWAAADRADLLDAVWERAASEHRTTVHRRGRFAVAGVAVAAAVAGAGAAAAATGVLPRATYDWMDGAGGDAPKAEQLDPASARKVFAVPGPHNTEFAGWTAANSKGWLCVTTVFEPTGTEVSPFAGGSLGTAGGCSDQPAVRGLFENGSGGTWGPAGDRVHFVWDAGDAVRAELQVSTGRTYPVQVQDGWLGGWYDVREVPFGASATIVVYGADGAVLRRYAAQTQGQCDQPRGC